MCVPLMVPLRTFLLGGCPRWQITGVHQAAWRCDVWEGGELLTDTVLRL